MTSIQVTERLLATIINEEKRLSRQAGAFSPFLTENTTKQP